MRHLVLPVAVLVVVIAARYAPAQRDLRLYEYTSEAGRYRAKFPEKPRSETKDLSTGPGGRVIPTLTDKAEGPRDAVYAVTIADYPESFRDVPEKAILDGVRDGLKATDGRVTEDNEITVGSGETKLAGRELRIEAGRNTVRARLFLSGTRLYQVMVTGSKNAVNGPTADEFLRSFELTK
jgi:hypothetical protein